ncbi:MAG: hypothetical protein WAU89_23440 [Candidatus Acidiferrales bacterium]
MATLFGGAPKMPAIPPPPRPPQIDSAQAQADQQDLIRRRRGTAADILTSGGARGALSPAPSGTATLLGQ